MFSRQGPPPAGGSRRETTHEAYRNDLILAKYIFPSPSLFPIMSLSRWGGALPMDHPRPCITLLFVLLPSRTASGATSRAVHLRNEGNGITLSHRRRISTSLPMGIARYCVNREGGFCYPAPTEEGTRFQHNGQKRHLMWVR